MVRYMVIEIGCKAYEPFVGNPPWINYSNWVTLPEALERKRHGNEMRAQQNCKHISYHIWKSTEPFKDFLKRVTS